MVSTVKTDIYYTKTNSRMHKHYLKILNITEKIKKQTHF